MRRRGRLALTAAAMRGALACGVSIVAGACGSGAYPKPVATLASSPRSGAAFEAIRDAWADPDATTPADLRKMLEQFLAQFPDDGLVPLARVALALVALRQGDFPTAEAQLALTESMPAGTASDLRTVARARAFRLRGDAETALSLLRPLVGKNVDPLARSVFEEELTLTALATHRDYEAISYMDAWLRVSTEEEKEANVKRVTALVERLPKETLLGALQAMRAQGATFGYGVDIQRILAARLVAIATSTGDARLARLLLDPDAGAIVVAGDAGVELGELATSRRGLDVVEGRTIGLLLPTGSPGLRDEAADVLRGMMWALGLPRGVRALAPVAPTTVDAGAVPGGVVGCAPPKPAPALDEPAPEQQVHLVTRDDEGNPDRTEVSLDELAGAGAAIVVAGLEPQTSARALRWGENHAVPVIALVPDEGPDGATADGGSGATPGGSSFGFVLGATRSEVLAVLVRAAPALLSPSGVPPVIDTSEALRFPAQGGQLGPLTVAPPVSCDLPPVRAGEPRFPVADWVRDRKQAWLVTGSPVCAGDVVSELSAARARGVVALTLEAATLLPHPAGLRVVSAAAGVVPSNPIGDPREEELLRFTATLGRASWWTALGRDAATLARVAAQGLPMDTVSDARSVAQRRAQARDRLSKAQARLWTTEENGWGGRQAMKRTVCALDAPGK